MSIESIISEYQQFTLKENYSSFSEVGSLFESVLLEESENITRPTPNPMPQPVEDEDGGEEATIVPMSQAAEESSGEATAVQEGTIIQTMAALMAMSEGGDWTYDRETLMGEVDTFLTALGVDHHDILEFTEMFPPEGAELDLVRMGKLVTKAGDIMAGRVDAGKLAELLPDSGMSEAQVQSWLTNMGVEYQRTGELMKAEGEAGGEYNATLVEENLVANLVNTLPEELTIADLAGLLAGTVGESALYAAMGSLMGDLG